MSAVGHFDDKSQDRDIESAYHVETTPKELLENNVAERGDYGRQTHGGNDIHNPDQEITFDVFDESSDKSEINKSDVWKILEKIARCVFSCFLFVFVFGTAIISRVLFHFMIENLNPPTNFTTINKIGGIKPTRIGNETNVETMAVVHVSWIWATYIAVLSPYLYNMVHYLWIACKKIDLFMDDTEDENDQSMTKRTTEKSEEIQRNETNDEKNTNLLGAGVQRAASDTNGKQKEPREQQTDRFQQDPKKYENPQFNRSDDEENLPNTSSTKEKKEENRSDDEENLPNTSGTKEKKEEKRENDKQGEKSENKLRNGSFNEEREVILNTCSINGTVKMSQASISDRDQRKDKSNSNTNENSLEENNRVADGKKENSDGKCHKISILVLLVGVIYVIQTIVEIIIVFYFLPIFDPCTASVVSAVMSLCIPSIEGTCKKTRKIEIPCFEENCCCNCCKIDEHKAKERILKIKVIVTLFLFVASVVFIAAYIGTLTSKLDNSVVVCFLLFSPFVSPLLPERILSCFKTKKEQQEVCFLSGLLTSFTDQQRNFILICGMFLKIIISFVTLLTVFIVRSKGSSYECLNVLFYTSANATIYMLDKDVTLSSEFKYYHRHAFFVMIVCVVSAYLCFKSCFLACRTQTQWQCFSLPLFLNYISVPFILWTAVRYPDKWNTDVFDVVPNEWLQEDIEYDFKIIPLLITSATLSFLVLFFHTLNVWNRGTKMWQFDKLFSSPYYCGLCLDASILLSRLPAKDNNNENREKTKPPKPPKPPFIYICATMWHEEEEEMKTFLKSIFRLHKYFTIAEEKHRGKKNNPNEDSPDYFEFAVHIFFDDAFNKAGTPNEHVNRFKKAMNEACRSVFHRGSLPDVKKKATPYGGRLEWNMNEIEKANHNLNNADACKFELHLKHKNKVKKKKRWSQVMYLYYLLVYKFGGLLKANDITHKEISTAEKYAKDMYILALDGDIDFKPNAIRLLLDCMEKREHVGAACGRLIPMGKGPVVWYQKFEYAASHWLQKSTEHVFGCVLCSPGCFSLFRASALMSTDIIKTYTKEPQKASDYIQYDQGEDRWLSTLLLKRGFKLEYMAASDARTSAPEGFFELFKQRRRWSPSTLANLLDILWNMNLITKRNSSIRKIFLLYQLFLFASSIITPGTIFLMILGAIHIAFPSIPIWLTFILNITPVGILMASCLLANDKTQLTIAGILSSVYSLIMVVVLVGLIIDAVNSEFCSVATYFFCYVVGIFILSALMHPKEVQYIFCGIIYFLSVPSTSMLMILYALGNLHVTAWGTREGLTSDKDNKTVHGEDENRCSCFGIDRCTRTSSVEKKTKEKTRKSTRKWNFGVSRQEEQRTEVFQDNIDSDEKIFWDDLIKEHLKPNTSNKKTRRKKNREIETKLLDLRNRVYFAFFLVNGIYITLVYVIEQINETNNGKFTLKIPCPNKDGVFDVDPISIIFTVTFGLVLFFQFVGMILHRFSTFIHIMAVTKVWKDPLDKDIKDSMSKKTRKVVPWLSSIKRILKSKQNIANNTHSGNGIIEETDNVTTP